MNGDSKDSPLFVGAAAKAFEVLEAFDPQTPDLSLTEVMARTGLNKSAAQRYLFTLGALGYLTKNPWSRRYALAIKTLFPASGFFNQDPLIRAAYPHIVELRQHLDARIGLSVRHGDRIVYLIPLQSSREAYRNDYPGFSLPLYCTTSGRIFLSVETEDAARSTLSHSPREAITPHTKTDIDEILEEVRSVRQQGYCLTNQETALGKINLGTPVLNGDRRPVACIVVVVQNACWSAERLVSEAWPRAQETAGRIQVPRDSET